MASDNVSTVSDDNFQQEVLKSKEPVMVDFWAVWCGPCQMAEPVIEEIATEQRGSVKVAKLNVDDNQKTAQEYGVMSIPTVILFQDGKEVDRKVGFAGKKMYMDLLSSVKKAD